ncbi:MAG: hypothetical protein KAT66_00485 [Candidatus Lokiarchaeota archaeon]|nr:hypothetical protein [Candidatus Lokiarchaeota archaeon]
MNKYTSLKLSKLLAENGFEKESEMWWGNTIGQKDQTCWRLYTKEEKEIPDTAMEYYPAYDILNDLCVKYAKEMFGEKYFTQNESEEAVDKQDLWDARGGTIDTVFDSYTYYFHTQKILYLLQQNKKDEAEEYLWEHCLFNPKNKL